MVYWCKKHCFVPIDKQLIHCQNQNWHKNCKNLIILPTEKPKLPRLENKKTRRQQRKKLERIYRHSIS